MYSTVQNETTQETAGTRNRSSNSEPDAECINANAETTTSDLPGLLSLRGRILCQEVGSELTTQLKISIPTILGLLLGKIPWLVSLHFAGELGKMSLAAAALATTLCNVTGMSLSVGLSSAITTLTGQSRGDLLLQGEKRRLKLEAIRSAYSAISNENKNVTFDEVDNEEVGERSILLPSPLPSPSKEMLNGSCDSVYPQRDASIVYPCQTGIDMAGERDIVEVRYQSRPSGIAEETQCCSIMSGNGESDFRNDEDLPDPPLMPLTYLYRGIFIQMMLLIPVGIWWLHGTKHVLLALGQSEVTSEMTQAYLRVLTPGLWSYSINWTVSAWLQALEIVDIPAYAALVGALLHVPCTILFVRVLGFGYIGVGMATVVFQFVQPCLIFAYIFGTNPGRNLLLEQTGAKAIGRTKLSFWTEVCAAVGSLQGICQYFSLALPGVITISEWWASETAIFLAGTLKPDPACALGGMSIYQSINGFCFMFSLGFSVAGSTRVGNSLGKSDIKSADLASKVSVASTALLGMFMGCVLYITPHSFFPSLFSPDEHVIYETSKTIPLLSIYVIADGIQVALYGIIKGCGRQAMTMPIVITAYWFVGLPIAYHSAFIKHGGEMCNDSYFCGIVGLVGGVTVGTWVHMLLLAFMVVITIRWQLEIGKAQKRMSLECGKVVILAREKLVA